MKLSVCVLASVSVCAALEYKYSLEADLSSKYDDEIFDKNTNEDTMEFMDQLKEELDASITPLSDMTFGSLESPFTLEDPTRTTQIDPHDYIRMRTSPTAASAVPEQRPRGRQKGKIGRPRKTTLFPMVTQAARVLKKRIKWDDNMNKFVMHSYYYVTKIETDKEQWRPKLRQKFVEVYPDFDSVTEQRLADQKRVIIQNLLLDRKVLVEIRRAVRKQLEMEGVTMTPVVEPREKSFYV